MLTPNQISELHRLHWVEKWSLRKIARHLHIGRRTIAKYLAAPAAKPAHRERGQKIEPWKAAIAELLEKDPDANAPVIAQHLKALGFDGGLTIIKDYLRILRKNSVARRAYVRVEPGPGERFDVDWATSALSSTTAPRGNFMASAWSKPTAGRCTSSSPTARPSRLSPDAISTLFTSSAE